MSNVIRLITDDIQIHYSNLDCSELQTDNNYIFRTPAGKFSTVCFSSHLNTPKKINPFVSELIKNDIGIVYVCEALPENPLIDPHIVYLVCPYRWYIHTLFHNPLQFRAVFSSPQSQRLARAFSEFTLYNIPHLRTDTDLQDFLKKSDADKNNVLLEITGGVGDHLMCIPAIKTLASKGKNVYLLCDKHRVPCFDNLPYIKGIFVHRSEVDVSRYSAIYMLHFGQILNDYRSELNKQNRIYAVAAMCGLNKADLVIDRPEIIFTDDELAEAKRKYNSYSQKIFFGFDSARVDARIPENIAQEKIDILKSKGFTVFISSLKKYSLKNCIDLSGQLELRQLFALIAVMDYVLTIDTGFLHIAGALNKKILALINFFDPSWRCSTYKNCTVFNPDVKCYPCVARQFVSSSQWQCHNKSCFENFYWERIFRELMHLKTGAKSKYIVPESIVINPESSKSKLSADFFLQLPSDISITSLEKKCDERIAAVWLGGIGDAVMLSYLVRAIMDKHPNAQIDVYVRDEQQTILFSMDYPRVRAKFFAGGWRALNNLLKSEYELIYEFQHYPYVWNMKDSRLNKPMNSKFYNSWSEASIDILNNWNGTLWEYFAQKTDLVLKEQHFRLPFSYLDSKVISSKLSQYNLPERYITIAPGCDKSVGIMKLWSEERWNRLITLLANDGVKIIYLGNKDGQSLSGVDRVICKNLLDVGLILSQSKLHISNEGGSIHLAHAVGTKSVVIFGPTKPELYGYKDNINLYLDKCPTCWWTVNEWSSHCKLGHSTCKNLNELTVEEVYSRVVSELNYQETVNV